MVLPARSEPETPSRPTYFQAGKGNILSHFAGLATPGPKQQNQQSDGNADGAVQLRQRRSQSTEAFAMGLTSSAASTATVALASSSVDNNQESSMTNVTSAVDEDESMSTLSSSTKLTRVEKLTLWKLERDEEKVSKKTSSRHSRRSSMDSHGSRRQSTDGKKNGPPVSAQRRRGTDADAKSDTNDDNQSDAALGSSSMFTLSYSPPRHRESKNSEPPPPTGSMFSIHISPPRRGSRENSATRSEADDQVQAAEPRGSAGSVRSVNELATPPSSLSKKSDTIHSSMDFLFRDLEEAEKAESAQTDKEKAFLFKKRYMDVYGFAVKLSERVHELEAERAVLISSRGSSEVGRGNVDELRMRSLCRRVEELSQDLREKESLIESLHSEQKELINDLKMSQASFGASSSGRPADSTAVYIAELEAKVARLEADKNQSSEEAQSMTTKIADMQRRLDAAQAERVHIQKSLRETEEQMELAHTQWLKERADLLDAMDASKTSLTKESEQLRRENTQLEKSVTEAGKGLRAELEDAKHKAADALLVKEQLESKLRNTQLQIAQFGEKETELVSLRSNLERLQREMDTAKSEMAMLRDELSQVKSDAEVKATEFADTVSEYQARILEAEVVRRSLHNKVMELKGNIRVFCRVRPVLRQELDGTSNEVIFNFPDYRGERRQIELFAAPRSHVSYGLSAARESIKKYPFDFDLVFNGQCSQEEVFTEVSALIQSALDGFNVCIFAYGQTGSGKTYTMQGVTEYQSGVPHPDMGIVGRAIAHIFASIEDMKSSGWSFSVGLELIEIYNETLRDLLAVPGSLDKVALRQDASGKPVIANSCVHTVRDEHEAWTLLQNAMGRRSTKFTNMNDHSSRSHCVISFRLTGENSVNEIQQTSVIHLVDLAGSERLSKSGSGADRELLKETQHINKSLSALGNVIAALAKKSNHVPFRDSKLTHFLSPSLGGDSKTLMICNLSPLPQHRDETLNSLRFAKTVNSCEIALPSYSSRS